MRGMQGLLVVASVALAACATGGSTARPERPHAAVPLHPVIAAYVATLDAWITEDERADLADIDLGGTLQGDPQRLRYLAADRVVRTLLPLGLEAQGRPDLLPHAARLRALPPLLNQDTDAVAAPVVRRAIEAMRGSSSAASPARLPASGARAPERYDGSAIDDPDALAEVARGSSVDSGLEAALADALAEYAEAYGQVHGVTRLAADAAAAAAADTLDAGLLFRTAVEQWGVPRGRAVDVAANLLGDMTQAARRRERIPYIPRPEERPRDPPHPLGR
jgi:hypothetical protein